VKALAIGLIVLGSLGLLWGGFTWTRSEKIVDIGPIEVSRDKKSNIPIPPLLGLAGVAAGVILLTRGK
jgi:hypothetical protein